MPDILSPEEERLHKLDETIEGWKESLLQAVEQAKVVGPPIDATYHERFADTQRRLLQLNEELHPADFDPEALAEIRDIILKWIAAFDAFDEERPLDTLDHSLVYAEAIRHLVRDALDGHVSGVGDDAQAVVRQLIAWLPHATQADLAELSGISPRQFLRWKKDGGRPSRRLDLVARLVTILRRGWTEQGVVAWFSRPRSELRGQPPIDVLDDPSFERSLLVSARQGRAQHGS